MSDECCETCRHWQRHAVGDKEEGVCRRYPPQLNPAAVDRIAGFPRHRQHEEYAANEAAYWSGACWAFPVLPPDEWCGEYAPVPAPSGAGSPPT